MSSIAVLRIAMRVRSFRHSRCQNASRPRRNWRCAPHPTASLAASGNRLLFQHGGLRAQQQGEERGQRQTQQNRSRCAPLVTWRSSHCQPRAFPPRNSASIAVRFL